MTTKKQSTDEKEKTIGRIRVGQLEEAEEKVKDLTDSEAKEVKGGASDLSAKFQVQLTEANGVFQRS